MKKETKKEILSWLLIILLITFGNIIGSVLAILIMNLL